MTSPCKYSIASNHIQESPLLWHPYVRIQYNNHLKHSLQFHCLVSDGNCSRLTFLRWNQTPHVSHSTIPSYVSKHLTSAEQFNLHMEVSLVTGASLSLQEVRSRSILHNVHTLYIGIKYITCRSSLSLHAPPHRPTKLQYPLHSPP